MAPATKTTVTIDVQIQGNHGTARDAEARCGDDVTWVIDGDLGPDDEVTVGPFTAPGRRSPMKDPEGRRQGNGKIDNAVNADATPDHYHYEIVVNRASGKPSVIDPVIQIKP